MMDGADDGPGGGHAASTASQSNTSMTCADNVFAAISGSYYMPASVAEQYQLLAATQNVLQYKRCNCKKAKCLKLYCVCFAAGRY